MCVRRRRCSDVISVRRLRGPLAALLGALAIVGGAAAARSGAGSLSTHSAAVTPLCSLYVVTVSTEVLLQDFNSPKLTYNAKKWPLLMAQAKNARIAFAAAPLLSARSRYDSLVRRLGVVGGRLIKGDRRGAYAELKSANPDLQAVVDVAQKRHLACRSATTTFYIR